MPPAARPPIAPEHSDTWGKQVSAYRYLLAYLLAEAGLVEARSHAIDALGAKLAVMEGCQLGVFSGDDQARVTVEEELADATQGYRTARPALKHIMDSIARWGQRQRVRAPA